MKLPLTGSKISALGTLSKPSTIIRTLAASGNQDTAVVQQGGGMRRTGVVKTAGQSKTRG